VGYRCTVDRAAKEILASDELVAFGQVDDAAAANALGEGEACSVEYFLEGCLTNAGRTVFVGGVKNNIAHVSTSVRAELPGDGDGHVAAQRSRLARPRDSPEHASRAQGLDSENDVAK
jgi:hypothetical protein